ncbi:MAG: arginine repressor, partial [Firmicutes bacterium]|nr:arginine repressor [Bacillota bacterium]
AHIVGSIAGDNTLFVAVDQKANVPAIIQEFNRILKGND